MISFEDVIGLAKRGIDYAFATQNPDGGWSGRAGMPDSFSVANDAAELLYGVLRCQPYTGPLSDSNQVGLNSGLDFLRSKAEKFPAETYEETAKTYCWALRTLSAAGENSNAPVIRHILKLLMKLKKTDEGWRNTPKGYSHVHNTGLAILALNQLGANEKEQNSAASWLLKIQNRDGSWGWFKGYHGNSVCTADVIAALKAVGGRRAYGQALKHAVRWLKSKQEYREGTEGRWVPVPEFEQTTTVVASSYMHFATPYAVDALVRSGVKTTSKPIQDGLSYLKTLQRDDGGWPFTDGFYWFPCKMSSISWATGNALWSIATCLENWS